MTEDFREMQTQETIALPDVPANKEDLQQWAQLVSDTVQKLHRTVYQDLLNLNRLLKGFALGANNIVDITRANANDKGLAIWINGKTYPSFRLDANGILWIGDGDHIPFNMYQSGNNFRFSSPVQTTVLNLIGWDTEPEANFVGNGSVVYANAAANFANGEGFYGYESGNWVKL